MAIALFGRKASTIALSAAAGALAPAALSMAHANIGASHDVVAGGAGAITGYVTGHTIEDAVIGGVAGYVAYKLLKRSRLLNMAGVRVSGHGHERGELCERCILEERQAIFAK